MTFLIVFDFDGPLFDARSARDKAFADTAKNFKNLYPVDKHSVCDSPLYGPAQTIQLAYAEGNLSRQKLQDIEDYYREKLIHYEQTAVPESGIMDALRTLNSAECTLAILSMRSETNLNMIVQSLRFDDFFKDYIFGRDTMDVRKPDPNALLQIIDKSGVNKNQTVFVGDSDYDLETARKAGVTYFHAGWSTEPSSKSGKNPDKVLSDANDLVMVVRGGIPDFGENQTAKEKLSLIMQEGRFSFFAGAGVSIASGIGDWNNSYLPILKKHFPQSVIQRIALPELVQLVMSDEEKAHELFDDFKESFSGAKLLPNPYHFSIVRSNSDSIWTTNYDGFFEKATTFSGQSISTIRDDQKLKDNFGRGRLIIKVNGDFSSGTYDSNPLNWGVVVSDEQFDLSELDRAEIWRYFEDEYRTSTLIFLGVSFHDPSLRRILSIISRKVMRTRHPHFVLAKLPEDPLDRYIFLLNAKSLKRHGIHTIHFNNFEELQDFIVHQCFLSTHPVVAFSGKTGRYEELEKDEKQWRKKKLDRGILTAGQISEICGNMGRRLAEAGFRVTSGHGLGVGVPAVEKAFKANRKLARFYLRSHGTTNASRLAPAIYVQGNKLQEVRERLIGAAHVLVAIGGDKDSATDSGTINEVKMAIKHGLPILLFTQGGGNIAQCYDELIDFVKSNIPDLKLRNVIVSYNEKIKNLTADDLIKFVDSEFIEAISTLVSLTFTSKDSRTFDESNEKANTDWL